MSKYSNAPWNAPVEDEGRELSDADIPTRRRSPGEKKEDVLTELIFGSYAEPKISGVPVVSKTPNNIVRRPAPTQEAPKKKIPIKIEKESPKDKRSRLLLELAALEQKEKEIASKLRTYERPTITKKTKEPAVESQIKRKIFSSLSTGQLKGGRRRGTSSSFKTSTSALSSPSAKLDGLHNKPVNALSSALPVVVPIKKEIKAQPVSLSRMDGLTGTGKKPQPIAVPAQPASSPQTLPPVQPSAQVSKVENLIPENLPVEQPFPVAAASHTQETEQKIYDYYTKDHEHPKKKHVLRHAILITVALIVVTGVLGVIDGKRLPNSFAFLSNISGFLRNTSFVISDENRQAFPSLVQLHSSVSEAKAQFDGSKELDELTDSLETFLSSNSSFSWHKLFAEGAPEIHNVAYLADVLKQKKVFEASHEHILLIDSNTLSESMSWISFLSELYAKKGRYLVVTLDNDHPTSIGGQPLYFGIVEVDGGRASVSKVGSATDFNAALTSKIIPPLAVQGIKTDFDFYEAGWFYTFDDSAQLMTLMYEQTTQEKIDGVIVVSRDTAETLLKTGGSSALVTETWIEELFKYLGSGSDLSRISDIIKDEFARGAIQASFEEQTLSDFARGRLNLIAEDETIDGLTASVRAWEGDGAEVSLLRYSPHFFGDGSIVGNAVLEIKNKGVQNGRAYVKLYIPKQSTLLDAEGFSQKVTPAPFDYGENGFAQHALIERLNERTSDEFVLLDLYDEGDFLVVGGWVFLPTQGTSQVSLLYRIPSRLDWRAGNARYDFTVLPVASGRDFPFQFAARFDDGVAFEWREPLGHVASQTAEFTKSLSSAIKLSSSITFSAQSGASQ